MPLLNDGHWIRRMGQASPLWSGEMWLDWEHERVIKRAYRRIWPRGEVRTAVDVGCGDGRLTRWMAQTFGCFVMGVDALEFPGVRDRVQFRCIDPERLHDEIDEVDLVVFSNSLTCLAHWEAALESASLVGRMILAFDNFQTPTPEWGKRVDYRQPIQVTDIDLKMRSLWMRRIRGVAADWFHRKLFLKTPQWSHPGVAVVTWWLDWAASIVLKPEQARHSALLYRRQM